MGEDTRMAIEESKRKKNRRNKEGEQRIWADTGDPEQTHIEILTYSVDIMLL